MTQQDSLGIVPGTVVEFFESKQILTGVCLVVRNTRLTILTEQNREINLAQSRVFHSARSPLNTSTLSRDELVHKLTEITSQRKHLMQHVDVEELWTLLESEEEGFDIQELTELVFSDTITENHLAAVQRVLLHDRLFFQFKEGKFFARSQEKVEQRRLEMEKAAEREAELIEGAQWLQTVWQRKPSAYSPDRSGPSWRDRVIESLKDYSLYEKESSHQSFVKELFKKAGIPPQPYSAFRLLVRLGIWHEDENLYLHQHDISPDFTEEVLDLAQHRVSSFKASINHFSQKLVNHRQDLRHIHSFTVDSPLTRDFDDALSLRLLDSGLFEVGIHIADAAEFVIHGDLLDEEAKSRVSTLYLPDGRIPMIPSSLSEDICSLQAGKDRFALSFFIHMDENAFIHDTQIVPSIVRIRERLTYEEVDQSLEKEPSFSTLHQICLKLKEQRINNGAVILPLPEIHLYVNAAGMIHLSRYEKETPSQLIVSELMIAANGLAASYLAEHQTPAIFRCQAECKPENQPIASEYEIFHVYRQRRLFARAELDTQPRTHCSLGMPRYTSVTSPIRRYVDLIVQRQLKHVLQTGEALYSEAQLRQLITQIEAFQSKLILIHRKWTRYWILKYLEQEDIRTLSALVLTRNERFAHLLLPDFLIEANLPLTDKVNVQPGEMVSVKVERVNPREDVLRLQL